MGILSDFREVIKGLKHKKRGEATINLCPKCESNKISIVSSVDTYPRLYGITPTKYVCSECGYRGPIVLEQTKDKKRKQVNRAVQYLAVVLNSCIGYEQ
ncbi:MAG: hypothetical protein NWF06_01040 [Candidatus Bathyarchaeota archaeon]|nr:hypothetical protein [Candidatus Bathyarchaeum sp.]